MSLAKTTSEAHGFSTKSLSLIVGEEVARLYTKKNFPLKMLFHAILCVSVYVSSVMEFYFLQSLGRPRVLHMEQNASSHAYQISR